RTSQKRALLERSQPPRGLPCAVQWSIAAAEVAAQRSGFLEVSSSSEHSGKPLASPGPKYRTARMVVAAIDGARTEHLLWALLPARRDVVDLAGRTSGLGVFGTFDQPGALEPVQGPVRLAVVETPEVAVERDDVDLELIGVNAVCACGEESED